MEEIRKKVFNKALNEYKKMEKQSKEGEIDISLYEMINKTDFLLYIQKYFDIKVIEKLDEMENPLSYLYDFWFWLYMEKNNFFEEKYKLIESKLLNN
ncbi:hypothetical protein [Anaerofustis butyriciformans]|uniref:hypothetical protein n=1 Tax=Anaerofustis butyriciformans TaxID=3108533 RepID=UPI002E34C677|nr:hypothetical protein [Anaerofustis sp. HA2171]